MSGGSSTTLEPISVYGAAPTPNPALASELGLPQDALFQAPERAMGYADYKLPGDDLGSQDYRRAYFDKDRKRGDDWSPPPTAPKPHPPELIPATHKAIAVCTSPDVCRSPTAPVPYQVWGKADDKHNYSPDVRSNGLVIKRHDSAFTRTYGDEPGTGKGVKSNTVGETVDPVTSSRIVRANGIPVQRHGDRCTLNRGNCPGEYVHVKSTETHDAPDGRDAMGKPWYERAWNWTGDKLGQAGQAIGAFDDAHGRVVTRGLGALQALGGTGEMLGGAALATGGGVATATGVGAAPGIPAMVGGTLLFGSGADNAATGLRQLWTGEAQTTAVQQAAGGVARALGASPETAGTVETVAGAAQGAAGGAGSAIAAASRTGRAIESGAQGARSTRAALKKTTYKRPSGFRKGVRDKVWEAARGPDGKVRDPLTGEEMNSSDPWDMGHKPGYEFRKSQDSAIDRGITRQEFLNEYNEPSHYRPELPSSNRSHAGEDMTDSYFGP